MADVSGIAPAQTKGSTSPTHGSMVAVASHVIKLIVGERSAVLVCGSSTGRLGILAGTGTLCSHTWPPPAQVVWP